MAEPRISSISSISSNLQTFLDYEFDKTKNPHLKLAVNKKKYAEAQLFVYNKTSKKVISLLDDDSSVEVKHNIEKVAKYVQENQERWLQSPSLSKNDKVKLEQQLAHLDSRVKEHNRESLRTIKYTNPAQWELHIKIKVVANEVNDNEVNDKELVELESSESKSTPQSSSKLIDQELSRDTRFTYDRLTTREQVLEKCQDIWNKVLLVTVDCKEEKCLLKKSDFHNKGRIRISPVELFGRMPEIKGLKFDQSAQAYWLSSNEEGGAREIVIEASQINAEQLSAAILKDHKKDYHELITGFRY